jgi:hypothetical protein
MKFTIALAAVLATALGTSIRASNPDPGVSGDYVEVRTAEIFTGPCMLGSEADTRGREAIMAWRVSRGAVDGVALDGLSIVAVVAGDRNLGMHELGGEVPTSVKAVVMVDDRATPVQRDALVKMARSLSPALVRDVVELKSLPISFLRTPADVKVKAGAASVDVTTTFEHSPTCGAMQWFTPLAATTKAALGFARSNAWSGAGLDTRWTQMDRKSSYVGTFTYGR